MAFGKERADNTIDLLVNLYNSFSDNCLEKELCKLIKKYIKELENYLILDMVLIFSI